MRSSAGDLENAGRFETRPRISRQRKAGRRQSCGRSMKKVAADWSEVLIDVYQTTLPYTTEDSSFHSRDLEDVIFCRSSIWPPSSTFLFPSPLQFIPFLFEVWYSDCSHALWEVVSCSLVGMYQRFGGAYFIWNVHLHPEDGGGKFLWSIGTCLQSYGATSQTVAIFSFLSLPSVLHAYSFVTSSI